MNDEVQKALADIINKVTAGADAVVKFGAEQVPEVLRQLLVCNFAQSFLTWLFALFVCVGYLIYMFTRFARWQRHNGKYSSEQDSMYMVVTVIWTIAAIMCIFIFFNNFDWLKIWLAPKLYLLEYAASIIKSSR